MARIASDVYTLRHLEVDPRRAGRSLSSDGDALFTSLPLESLDKLTLQKRLHEIGRDAPPTE